MSVRFHPSLQQVAKVRIALKFLYEYKFKVVCANFLGDRGKKEHFYSECILRRVHLLSLPDAVERNIASIVRALAMEVAEWYKIHKDLLPDADLDYWGTICWYSHGTIDYLATARAFLLDKHLNRRQRFVLSCQYYLEDDVHALWRQMTAFDLNCIAGSTGLTGNFRYWMEALHSNTKLNWMRISREASIVNYYCRTGFPKHFFSGNLLGLIHYFPKLRLAEARFRCLYRAILKESIRPFYLYLCLAEMSDHEVDAMFDRFPEGHRYQLFVSFLHWPLQSIFLNIIERFRHRISNPMYIDLFEFILFDKFERGLFDYEYVSLVKQLWAPLPESTKSYLRKSRFIPCIEHIMNLGDQDPIPTNLIKLCARRG
ncbi:uncharacterized protein TNCV_194741 [Trichonephila clavipes]|nr:uncharacterized protein TNCV_194741 [Trichonephila clavipes]